MQATGPAARRVSNTPPAATPGGPAATLPSVFQYSPESSLLLVGCSLGLAMAAVLLVRARREGRIADALAAGILLVGTLYAAQWMLGFAGWYDGRDARSTVMFYVEWSHLAALGPLAYLYVRAVTNTDFRLRRRHLRHFAPALVFAAVPLAALVYDFVVHAGVLGRPFEGFGGTRGPLMDFKHESLVWIDWIEDAFVRIQLPVYLVLAIRVYRGFRAYVRAEFANPDEFDLRGLSVLLYILVAGVVLAFGSELVALAAGVESYADVWNRHFFVSAMVFAAAIQFHGIHPRRTRSLRYEQRVEEVEGGKGGAEVEEAEGMEGGEGVEGGALAPRAEWAALAARLDARLAEHRDYLEPDLKLGELAARLGATPAQLSRAINAVHGVNFNDFVNARRCAAFVERVRAGEHARHTLLSLALDSGFNSKSTFNRAFRKLYGYPPGEAAARVE